jgi:CHAT domain-containing protein
MLVKVSVMQKGVDVAVRALDRQKNRLAGAEDSFGRKGPQDLEFISESASEYIIEVVARIRELGGTYEIEYVEARPVTTADRTRVVANSHVTAGNGNRSRVTPEGLRAALVEYEKALKLYRQIDDRTGQAVALQYTARVYEAQADYRRALDHYSSALTLWRQVHDRRGEALNTSNIGTMNLYLGNLTVAFASFREAHEIYKEVGNREGEALCYQEMGNVYRQQGELTKALELFEQALNIFREVGAKQRMLYVLSNMGVAHEGLGNLQRAIDYQNQALTLGRELDLRHGTALALMNVGDIHAQQGETRRALSFYQQALPLCLAVDDENCAGRTYRRLASVYESLGETQTALDHYAKCVAIYRQKERPVELARILNSAGALYSSLGDKKRAFDLHTEALTVSRKAQSRQDEAASLAKLAEIYGDQGDIAKTQDLYRQALAINREIKNRTGEAANLNRLGLLAHAGGNRSEALKLFDQALTINTQVGARYEGALSLNNLGGAHDSAGNLKVAVEHFSRALTSFREIENRSGEAMMLYRIASVQKKLGQIDEARGNIRAALEIVETIRGKIANTDLRSSYFATVQQHYELYIELLMRSHHERPKENFDLMALQASEQARARSLLDLLQEANAQVEQGADAKLLALEKELLERINGKAAQQQQAFSDPKKADLARSLGEEIKRLSDEHEALEARIRQSNPHYAELFRVRPMPLDKVQDLLDANTLMLEYKLGDERSYAWLVSQTKLQSYELPARTEIESLSRQTYQLLTERNRLLKSETPAQKHSRVQAAETQLRSTLARLRQMLVAPLGDSINGKRLVVVADGALQYVPFSVLVDAGDGLAHQSEILSLPSISVLLQLRRERGERQSPAKSVLVFADPVFESDDPRISRTVRRQVMKPSNSPLAESQGDFEFGLNGASLPRLLASREEAKAIVDLAPPGSSYGALDFEATRERALSADLNQYRVLHFASHALLNTARPQLSGIVLSLYDEKGNARDGFLRLNQIYNLRLSSDLVVLSACNTALGKDVRGEGLIGLTRGFMYAGAPRVIASLWKVDDEATAELMKIFYRKLLREKMTAAKALRGAQTELQQQARWRSPYYWGAFVLQGDWR